MIKVRIAGIKDTEVITRIHVESWRRGYAEILPEQFLRSINHDQRMLRWRSSIMEGTIKIYVLEDSSEVVGFACIGQSREGDIKGLELVAIYLDPKHYGKGKGSLFWDRLESLSSRFGDTIFLWVLATNARARHFYEKNGFKLVPGRCKNFTIAGADFPEVMYTKNLNKSI